MLQVEPPRLVLDCEFLAVNWFETPEVVPAWEHYEVSRESIAPDV
jgi:hypothetical protein